MNTQASHSLEAHSKKTPKRNCYVIGILSGKEKAHKHKQIWGGLPTGRGGGFPDRSGGCLPTGGQGSKVCVLCAEPKERKRFRPGTRPGGIGFPAGRIGDRGDREIVYVPNVYVPFPAPILDLGKPQMWERPHAGFGGTRSKRKGPCTKQCAWRKHGSCDTRLAEACPPKL